MLILTTALYCEALPFIEYYHLKKDNSFVKVQVFRNEDILLLITKSGAIHAAIGTAYLCSRINPSPKDLFVNIGVCGSSLKEDTPGTLYLCNQIMEWETKRFFYPDILYTHPFKERSIISSPIVVSSDNFFTDQADAGKIDLHQTIINQATLVDMESAGFYQAASYFYQPHQIFFLKIVSDNLTNAAITPDKITALIKGNIPLITDWTATIKTEFDKNNSALTPEEEAYLGTLSKDLCLSVSMENQLIQLCKYYKLKEGTLIEPIREFIKDNALPCKTKIEGKKYFEQLRQKFI
ncbi:5'-methylthioadenosine/S-adenosylhomocysteine nucleosidase family protein [Anaerocolumna sp. MB42-C2]|uniref:5'-methylthioadenosine/S-adenosylhomocysteine nucleosidase family protein n=1 Tax=Anaerocolumna sp. MB42-C2 TaxID=3070997 RepID=UPI0027E19EEA|nr:hypothetical protein [Anaerocolumna sp. MB42-C2]WMJ88934.1 hypothetical protein RBU59_05280 [Anaerocolumna sp. MB42-C2]